MLVPPGYRGTVPSGLVVIRPATKLVLLLGRTLASGTADTAAAVALLQQLLGDAARRVRDRHADAAARPGGVPQADAGEGADGHRLLHRARERPGRRSAAGRRIAVRCTHSRAAGPPAFLVTPGFPPPPITPPSPAVAQRRDGRCRAGPQRAERPGDRVAPQPRAGSLGSAGRRHRPTPLISARITLDRALVAAIGLEANTNATALYLTQDRDSKRRPLNGRYAYRVRFAPGQLPPVAAFWSLTLYDSRILFYPNPLNRYSLGDRTPRLRRDRDGGLTIIVSHRAPPAAQRSNWLPAPAGSFSLYLRLYEPKPAAVHGRWRPPLVVRALAGYAAPAKNRRGFSRSIWSTCSWRDPAPQQLRHDVLDDVQVVPVGRDLLAQAGREPVGEAPSRPARAPAVGVAALAHRDDGRHPLLERAAGCPGRSGPCRAARRIQPAPPGSRGRWCRRSGRASPAAGRPPPRRAPAAHPDPARAAPRCGCRSACRSGGAPGRPSAPRARRARSAPRRRSRT